MINACSVSCLSRELSTLGAMPSSSCWSSLKRLGPSSSAATTSSVQRSPTRASASASGLLGARFMEGAHDSRRRPRVLTCKLQVTLLDELQRTIQAAAATVGPAVVGLRRGSGIVTAKDEVFTVAHVLRGD